MSTTIQRATDATPPYCREDWQRGYRSLKQESSYWIDDIDGTIPPELTGTLFRNGPGLLDVNGQPIHHPFDGDGMICRLTLQQGRAHFANRFVRTAGYVAEQQAGRILYRGVFGTQKPGGWLANAFDFSIKNIANTNVLYWGEKLLALWEAAEPHRLDPATLTTLGLDDLDGLLAEAPAFAAHPRIDPACAAAGGDRVLVNFAIKPGLSTTLSVYEFASSGRLRAQTQHSTPGFAFIHDFAITPNYAIFFQNPVQFNPFPYLLGWRTAGECITFQPQRATQMIVMPRPGTSAAAATRTFPVDSGFVFHHANAFEDGETLVVDSVCYADLPSVEPESDFRQVDFEALAPGQLWRFRLHLPTGTVESECLESRCCEFPVLHPARVGREARYLYLAAAHNPTGNAPHQAILKIDLATGDRQLWSAAPWGYVGEPIFVPRSGNLTDVVGAEDDGWVLTLVFNATRDRSDVVILDAQDFNRGPLATLHLSHHVPYGLHGSFTPTVFLPEDAI